MVQESLGGTPQSSQLSEIDARRRLAEHESDERTALNRTRHPLLEVLQQVRGNENLKMIPVVVLTSSHEERDLVQSYKLGVNAYVVKPVDFHQFVNAVKELGVFWAVINQPPPGSVKGK